MRETSLSEISEEREFWCGTVLRYYYEENNFYDYLLAHVPWEEGMLLINITENDSKRGLGFGSVIPVKDKSQFTVNKEGFKYTLGELTDWYLIER